MPDYRRAWHPGGTYFFTVNLLQRQGNDLLIRHVDLLREAVAVDQNRFFQGAAKNRMAFRRTGGVQREGYLATFNFSPAG